MRPAVFNGACENLLILCVNISRLGTFCKTG